MDQHPAGAPYDPEAALDEFYEQLTDVTPFDSHAMVAAWGAIDAAERSAAWQLVREATKATDREGLLDEAREAVLRWSRESGYALEGSPYSLTHGDDLNRAEARTAALPPVLDAAAATLVRDHLPVDVFDVLYAPWAAGIEGEEIEGDPGDKGTEDDEDEGDDEADEDDEDEADDDLEEPGEGEGDDDDGDDDDGDDEEDDADDADDADDDFEDDGEPDRGR